VFIVADRPTLLLVLDMLLDRYDDEHNQTVPRVIDKHLMLHGYRRNIRTRITKDVCSDFIEKGIFTPHERLENLYSVDIHEAQWYHDYLVEKENA
jgi:hypothetical protein